MADGEWAACRELSDLVGMEAVKGIAVVCYRAPNTQHKQLNRGAAMRNSFCKNHETREDFGNATYAPFDSGASRRKFLKALAAAGASAVLPASGLLGQSTTGGSRVAPGRIDVHHHMFPPFYIKPMKH